MTAYETFFELHRQEKPLLLANVWNAKSARVAETAGFKAIATSSGAIAESLGYKDGEQIPFAELLYIVQRITPGIKIPLSVDFERGYTDDLKTLNQHIQQLIDCGVVGINLEDAQGDDIYIKKLSSIKEYLDRTNQSLFVNARTDGFLQKIASPLEATIKRAERYAAIGADGLFVTGVQDINTIKTIVGSTALPVNVVGMSKNYSVEDLQHAGVKRISMAVFLYRATYAGMEKIAKDIVDNNSMTGLV